MCGPFGKRSLRKKEIHIVGIDLRAVRSLKEEMHVVGMVEYCRDGCPNRPFIERKIHNVGIALRAVRSFKEKYML